MSICPLSKTPCRKDCAWWIQEDHMCAATMMALNLKDFRDICQRSFEECHEVPQEDGDKETYLYNLKKAAIEFYKFKSEYNDGFYNGLLFFSAFYGLTGQELNDIAAEAMKIALNEQNEGPVYDCSTYGEGQ